MDATDKKKGALLRLAQGRVRARKGMSAAASRAGRHDKADRFEGDADKLIREIIGGKYGR